MKQIIALLALYKVTDMLAKPDNEIPLCWKLLRWALFSCVIIILVSISVDIAVDSACNVIERIGAVK